MSPEHRTFSELIWFIHTYVKSTLVLSGQNAGLWPGGERGVRVSTSAAAAASCVWMFSVFPACVDVFVFACVFVFCTLTPHQCELMWGPSGLLWRGSWSCSGPGVKGRAGPAAVPPHLHINPRCKALCQQQYRAAPVAPSQTTQAHTPLSLFYCPWNGACSKYYLPLCFIPPFIPKSAGRRKELWGWVTFSPLSSLLWNHRQRQRLPGDERFCLLRDRCGFEQILLSWGNARAGRGGRVRRDLYF